MLKQQLHDFRMSDINRGYHQGSLIEGDNNMGEPAMLIAVSFWLYQALAMLNWITSDFEDSVLGHCVTANCTKHPAQRSTLNGLDSNDDLFFAGEDVKIGVVGILLVLCAKGHGDLRPKYPK